jgi:hypothetical protein
MTRVEHTALVLAVLAALAIGAICLAVDSTRPEPKPQPVPNTAASVGKCIQGHRVLWAETRAQAAEACLASLDAEGEQAFSQTWHNFETEVGSW